MHALSLLPADPTLTLYNVTTVVAPVSNWTWLGECLDVPAAKCSEIGRKYPTDEKKKEAFMDYWLHCTPGVCWGKLAGALHYLGEKQSLQLVQRHLKKTTGMFLMIIIRHNRPQ